MKQIRFFKQKVKSGMVSSGVKSLAVRPTELAAFVPHVPGARPPGELKSPCGCWLPSRCLGERGMHPSHHCAER